MKKPEDQEPQGFDVFKTASAVIRSTFGKTPARTWLAKPFASAAKKRAPRKKAVRATAPAKRKTPAGSRVGSLSGTQRLQG
jgi:hypothetical protein